MTKIDFVNNKLMQMVAGCVAWFLLWGLVPWMAHPFGFETFTHDETTQLLLECSVTLIATTATLIVTHRYMRKLLGWDKPRRWLYVMPLIPLVTLPLHYHISGGFPPYIYGIWMLISVFWQQYITFGLLQSFLAERLNDKRAMWTTILAFYLGHALTVPSKFAPFNQQGIVMALFIITIGVIFAWLKRRTGNVKTNLIVHWLFYFVVV